MSFVLSLKFIIHMQEGGMKIKFHSTKARLNLVLVSIVLFSITTVTLTSIYHIYDSWILENRNQIDQQVNLMNQEIELYIQNITENTRMLANFEVIKALDDSVTSYVELSTVAGSVDMVPSQYTGIEQQVYNILKTFQENHLSVKNASVGVEINGGFIKSPPSPRFNGYDARERSWYKIAMENKDEVVIPGIYLTSSNEQVVLCVTTIRDKNDQIIGVVTVDFDLNDLSEILMNMRIRETGYVVVTDERGQILGHPKDPTLIGSNISELGFEEFLLNDGVQEKVADMQLHDIDYEVESLSSNLDFIELYYFVFIEKSELNSVLFSLFKDLTLTALVLLLLVSLFSRRLATRLTNSIIRLNKVTEKIASGDLSTRVVVDSEDEIGLLSVRFNEMAESLEKSKDNLESLVSDRTQELSEANRELIDLNNELNSTLTLLQSTQKQLIKSERMAGLGCMVSGVAHELNTPVGTVLTTFTYIDKMITEFQERFSSNTLSKKYVQKYLHDSTNASAIINDSLQEILDLIGQFKNISADEIEQRMELIKVKSLILDVVEEYSETLKQEDFKLKIICSDLLQSFVYPEALKKSIRQLLDNTLKYAYDDQDVKKIEIEIDVINEEVRLRYSDYGRGIDSKQVDRIFDPFYTSDRAAGALGLGLNLVYNTITNLLRGTIDIDTSKSLGLHFIITWPK